jgi:UDP-GlcNAc:undecaprenyl-phosphate GlcNAc-1-phosphate transferase
MTGDRAFYLQAALLCAGLAGWFSWMVTPAVRALALRLGAVQTPRARDVHVEPVPRLGGLAIYAAFTGALLVTALVVHFVFDRPVAGRALFAGVGLMTAGTLLTGLGVLDDLKEISAGKQMLLQLACAAVALPFGVRIQVLSNPFAGGQMFNLGWVSYPLTLLWLVGVTNAVNWVDGIDGLAAGVSAIAAATLALMAVQSRQPGLAIVAAALFGSLVGFLRYNFNPATIFMGGGALFVGFTLAAIATVGAFKVATTMAIGAPLLILGLPLFDTTMVILRRWRGGRPIYEADQSHLHHRLLAAGFTQRQTVLILYGISLTLCAMAFSVFLFFGH